MAQKRIAWWQALAVTVSNVGDGSGYALSGRKAWITSASETAPIGGGSGTIAGAPGRPLTRRSGHRTETWVAPVA